MAVHLRPACYCEAVRFAKDIVVDRPPEQVWAFLWDVERVARCLPGCEEVRTVVPLQRYAAVVAERVGPFKVRFPLEIEVLEVDEGRRMKAQAAGRDAALGSSLRVTIELHLEPRDTGSVIHLVADAAVLGRLGTLGQGMIERKAGQIMEGFAGSLREALQSA
jgi:carbon monoxide dehydrogenase subunit G